MPVLDAAGEIRQHRGATPAPGLFVVGLPGMIRRNSTFIDGVGADALEVAQSLCAHVGHECQLLTDAARGAVNPGA